MSDSTDPNDKLTVGQFVMEARLYASVKAEHGGHRWHLLLQLFLVAIVVGSIGAGYEFHVNELYFVAGGTLIVMLAGYIHARLFSGYYAIYCKEWTRANGLVIDRDKLTKQLDDIRKSPGWTEADAAREAILIDVRRWFQSGGVLLSKIDGEIASMPGPFLSNELMTELAAWNTGADNYVASTFKEFFSQFQSIQGMPPMPWPDHRGMMRKEVYRRVERFRQLKARFEPDAVQAHDAAERLTAQNRKLREGLGKLVAGGNELMVAINSARNELPIKQAQDWMDNAAAEIAKLLDSSYVARFHSPAGTGPPDLASNPTSRLSAAIRFRLMRLNEFLAELSQRNA
jgi:hypothetical protein